MSSKHLSKLSPKSKAEACFSRSGKRAICIFISVIALLLSACLDEGVAPHSIRGDDRYDIKVSSSSEESSSSQISVCSSSEEVSSSSEPYYSLGYVAADSSYMTTTFLARTFMVENESTPCGHFKDNCVDTLGACYGNDPEYCKKYGRLYTWTEAMALPAFCDSVNCDSLVDENHAQGICPPGFHVGVFDDWDKSSTLIAFVNFWRTGRKFGGILKSSEEWNGIDEVAFNALPGGYADENGEFRGLEDETYFWLSTNMALSCKTADETRMRVLHLTSDSDDLAVGAFLSKKARAYVRCEKNK